MRFGRGYSAWTAGLGGGDDFDGRGGFGFGRGHHGHPGHSGHGGWGEDSEGRGGRGGRRRMFDGGELKLVLLGLIAEQPRHGYDLIRAIEEATGGAYAPSPGVVYPTLTMLGDMGQIEETPSDGNRKIFAATAEGRRVLDEKAAEVAMLIDRLGRVAAMRERTDGVSIRRAMHNLKNVLRHKLGGEGASQETINAAVALIDEAAGKIERL
jgi:DNA-binding PadR family transcriptional regulator